MTRTDVISIDTEILNEIKMHGATIQGLYQSTMHLSIGHRIVTIGHTIGKGKHHIVTKDAIAFNLLPWVNGVDACFEDNAIKIGGLIELSVLPEALRTFQPYLKTYRMNEQSYKTIISLKKLIEEGQHESFYRFQTDDRWHKFQFERIGTFLAAPGYHSARSILGLGMGLTPLGDDVLTGFILGLNTVNQTLPWIEQLVSCAQRETNRLSAQNLADTLNRYYPDAFIQMIEGIMMEHSIEKSKSILSLGATSGAGILTGFVYGCMQRG